MSEKFKSLSVCAIFDVLEMLCIYSIYALHVMPFIDYD